ncbi:MAG: hypothetical protein KY442_13770, partial [Proteobacteria bacterium]|nr:hypothetical protein [Pseudomonadota bacterium]
TALPRLAVACLLRAVALLLVRRPQAAIDELSALLHVLGRPAALVAARRRRRATRTVPRPSLQPLMSSPWERAQTRLSAVLDRRRQLRKRGVCAGS